MSRTLALAALVAATAASMTLGGSSAYAGCAYSPSLAQNSTRQIPQIALKAPAGVVHHGDAGSNIVGTWLATYTVEGSAFGQAYIQWHSDGTEWENINLPVESGNLCMGSWKPIDAKHVYRNHWGWLYTNGTVSGYFNETETDKVTHNGTYTGTNEQIGYDLNGNQIFDVTGTSSAVLISP